MYFVYFHLLSPTLSRMGQSRVPGCVFILKTLYTCNIVLNNKSVSSYIYFV